MTHTEESLMALANKVRNLLDYDKETGEFRWRERRGGTANKGSVAGGTRPDGYRLISIGNRRYTAHRLAWLYVYGVWPAGEIDHVNEEKADNRIDNLREASHVDNSQNQQKARNNSESGLRGASKHNDGWQAAIRANGKRHYLGLFATPEEAHTAYMQAKKRFHPFAAIKE